GIFMKCGISCAGFTGLSEDGTWSTWSANSENGLCLKKIPENEWDEDFIVQKMRDLTRSKNTPRILRKYNQRIGGNFGNTLVIANTGLRPIEQTNPVCANCNFICVADPKKRVELYNLLKKSGKVFLDEKGQEFVKKFDENGKEITYYPPTWEEYKKANMIE
ncbi:MAG: hypothetical protein GY870_20940, partial [archaeon]|nr:hypothetical protein [archaeon]